MLAALLLPLLPCACTRIISTGEKPEVWLRFDPVLISATKAEEAPGEYPAGTPFGVSVWEYAAGGEATGGSVLLADTRITCREGEWTPEPGVLWPGEEQELAVLAYAPFGRAAAIDQQEGIQFQGVDMEKEQTELLYTDFREGLTRDHGGVVNLPFRHALAYVDFSLRTNAMASQKVEVRGIRLLSLYTKGSFHSLPQPEWTLSDAAHSVSFFTGKQEVIAENKVVSGSGAWVLPQIIQSTVEVSLDFTAGGITSNLTLTSEPLVKRFEDGRHYTIVLSYLPEVNKLELDETLHHVL